MDRTDRALLAALQADSSRSVAELSERVHLSPSACHRRIKALEEQGVIAGYVARLDARKIGLPAEVMVEITLNSQSSEAMERFERAVCDFDDILECNLMSGGADYQLRVAAAGLDHYERIHRDCLSRLPGVSSMKTSFSLRRVKRFAGYSVP
ncbi:Lrp/AsnC family transcriptional regulator [Novosphingobium sp. YJ-S2-02]|uniref:Lrp/AsnC family transcriptional regulator n=1 Tax=Novosphingobium aureum TaxID=2792964 RepID=A0A931MMU5_9SPHN|nr:Lrp/AsnC family transcriptional regulator [Novosphingobium aureum]MBH0114774.1 Lrp/AsnC family transcriptional regulator [Novosphingobium aureum]